MTFTAIMVSCPERADVLARTLESLSRTDWGTPVEVVMDDATGPDRLGRIAATWQRALALAATSEADLSLLLEDDLDFNCHLRQNLENWPALRGTRGSHPIFASLYNPGFRARHVSIEDCFQITEPTVCWGAQALVVSRALAAFILGHWSEESGDPDLRMPRLAGRIVPVHHHRPSLVEHVGTLSTWGGRFHQSLDFDRAWRTSFASR